MRTRSENHFWIWIVRKRNAILKPIESRTAGHPVPAEPAGLRVGPRARSGARPPLAAARRHDGALDDPPRCGLRLEVLLPAVAALGS